jgi:hypothetical protein
MPPAETPKVLTAEPGGKQHWSIDVAFPVYAIAFTNDRTVVLAGGGGSSRTGVKNRLVSMRNLEGAQREGGGRWEVVVAGDEGRSCRSCAARVASRGPQELVQVQLQGLGALVGLSRELWGH